MQIVVKSMNVSRDLDEPAKSLANFMILRLPKLLPDLTRLVDPFSGVSPVLLVGWQESRSA